MKRVGLILNDLLKEKIFIEEDAVVKSKLQQAEYCLEVFMKSNAGRKHPDNYWVKKALKEVQKTIKYMEITR